MLGSQRGLAPHLTGGSVPLPGQLEHTRLLHGLALARHCQRQSLSLVGLGLVGVGVDDQEAGSEEAQEGAAGCHDGYDPHTAYHFHHRTQSRGHQDLGDVDLTGQDGTVDAKASLRVPRTVVDILQRNNSVNIRNYKESIINN